MRVRILDEMAWSSPEREPDEGDGRNGRIGESGGRAKLNLALRKKKTLTRPSRDDEHRNRPSLFVTPRPSTHPLY